MTVIRDRRSVARFTTHPEHLGSGHTLEKAPEIYHRAKPFTCQGMFRVHTWHRRAKVFIRRDARPGA